MDFRSKGKPTGMLLSGVSFTLMKSSDKRDIL